MTTTLSALSPLLPAAPAPGKPAGQGGVGAEDSAFARALSRAQGDEPPSAPAAPAAPGGKRGGRSPAATDRGDVAPKPGGPVDPARPGDAREAESTEDEAAAEGTLPADLVSMIKDLLGLPATPAPTASAGSAPGDAAAGNAVGAAALAATAAANGAKVGAGNEADHGATLSVPATPGAGSEARTGDDGSPAGGARTAPQEADLSAPAADAPALAAASDDGPAGLVSSSDALARPAAEPMATPSATWMSNVGTAGAAGPQPTGTTTSAAFEAHLSAALSGPDFAPALGQQIRVLVQDGVQHARLHLNPADMGPITVQIALDGQAAQVHLAAEQPLTRQALEQAMPVLASALRDSGLTLSGGGVFEQPSDPQRDGAGTQAGSGRLDDAQPDDGLPAAPPSIATRRLRGAVDLIA